MEEENIVDMNDETPENFTRFGDGHKKKIETRYTDGEPPAENEVPNASSEEEEE